MPGMLKTLFAASCLAVGVCAQALTVTKDISAAFTYFEVFIPENSRATSLRWNKTGGDVTTYVSLGPVDDGYGGLTGDSYGFTSQSNGAGQIPVSLLNACLSGSDVSTTVYLATKCKVPECVSTQATFNFEVEANPPMKDIGIDTTVQLTEETTILKFTVPTEFDKSNRLSVVFPDGQTPTNFEMDRLDEVVAGGFCINRARTGKDTNKDIGALATSTTVLYIRLSGTIGTYDLNGSPYVLNYNVQLTSTALTGTALCNEQKNKCKAYATRGCKVAYDLGCQYCSEKVELFGSIIAGSSGCSYTPPSDFIDDDVCAQQDAAGNIVAGADYHHCNDWVCNGFLCTDPSYVPGGGPVDSGPGSQLSAASLVSAPAGVMMFAAVALLFTYD